MAVASRKPSTKAARAPAPVVEAVKADLAAATVSPAVIEAAKANVESTVRQATEQTFAGAREAQEQFRKAVEQSVAQSRAAYEKLRHVAEEATGSLESSYTAATKGVNSFNAKAIDALKAQSEATLEHVKSVMSAKSLGEAIALQSAHARKQFETFSAQAKDFAELAQKIATEAAEPLKASFSKGFKQ